MGHCFLVMGVSGSGKSTVGQLIADTYEVPFLEGDSFHPEANINKMQSGLSLNDEDRWPWLDTLGQKGASLHDSGFVMACSALKKSYRDRLRHHIGDDLIIIHLSGTFDLIMNRMKARSDHFMPPALLQSQFDDLEASQHAWIYDISIPPKEIVNNIINQLKKMGNKIDNTGSAEIGVLGLGVMGKSLARNFASRAIKTAVFNIPLPGEENAVQDFVKSFPEADFIGGDDLDDFINKLALPRTVLLMIKAGAPVDEMIEKISPLLDKGDIIIDAGNSYYKDSIRRYKTLEDRGIEYVGMGVSGGEEGALKGPAMMPAGSTHSRDHLLPMLRKIAAIADDQPCVDWIGNDGAGHFVKMIHNGIEYADMQLLTEVYTIGKNVLCYTNEQTADMLESWKSTIHNSYLLDITIDILRKKEDGHSLLEQILDVAGHKGTGLWTSKEALDLGVPIPTIACAMTERILSSKKTLRESLSQISSPNGRAIEITKDVLRDGFLFSRLVALAEGFYLIKAASDKYDWDVNMPGLAQVWRGGCIIRSEMLLEIIADMKKGGVKEHFLAMDGFAHLMTSLEGSAFELLSKVALSPVSTPALSASISYYKSLKTKYLPINMIQAQRDYFGAHTYRRLDDRETPRHTQW